MDSFRLGNVLNIFNRLVFGSVLALPLSLSNYNLSHQEGLNLKYSKTAPPLAIFDDERIALETDSEEISVKPKKETLVSNQIQTRKMVQKISRRFAILQKSVEQVEAPKPQVRMLAGLSIKKSSTNVQILSGKPTRTMPIVTVKAQPPQKVHSPEAQLFEASLNPRQRDRVEEIENFDEIYSEDYGTESFEQRARTVLAEAGVDPDQPSEKEKEIINTYAVRTGSSRVTYSDRMAAANERSQRWASNFGKRFRKGTDAGNPVEPALPETPEKAGGDKSSEKGTTIASRGAVNSAVMSGTLEMTKGLAFTGTQKIIVYRQIGGTRYGYGQVMVDQGRYEIYVDQPNTGVVIAELLDNDVMVGRAEILMPEVMLNRSGKDLKNIPIKLEPVLDQVVAENTSAYSYYKKEKLKNSQIKISEVLSNNQKLFHSSVVMKAYKENHWGNIILGSSKQLFKHILNPDNTMEALKDILGIKASKEQIGIIKGEVSILGKPVSDAQVEIIGEGAINKAVYFNSFIPDQTLEQTTANGQYAFVGIEPGSYLVRAKYKGKYLSPQVAPVESGFVTQVQFDVQKPSLAEAFIFDIQTSEMMNADISFLGSETRVPVSARKLISFSGTEGIQFLEVQAQDSNYYNTRMTVDKSEKEILIPMISQAWLSDLTNRLKVNVLPDTGLIIGTALELPYAVELDPNAYNEDTKIIYFDNQGRMVPGAMMTPQGGGFVAVNVNQGIRSLFNKYHGTQNLKITTMAVDSNAINVFTSKF